MEGLNSEITIVVRLFAEIRERAGSDQIEIQIPSHTTTEHLLQAVEAQHPVLCPLLKVTSLSVAVNHEMVNGALHLTTIDEVALFPPITGG